MTAFLMECYENGILNKERTGGLELSFGNAEADLEFLHLIAKNEGFGKIGALGAHKQKEYFAAQGWGDMDFMNDIAMEQKGLEYSEYSSKESLAQQGGYGLTNKGPQHDEAWLIFMDQVNNQIPTSRTRRRRFTTIPDSVPGSDFLDYVNFRGTISFRRTTV